MEAFFSSIIAVAFVLGVMILVHEWGHYAAAKMFGVRVDVFSIGFGKRLVGFRRGETDYRISAIPLGGYVKMAGENPMEARTGSPDEFMSHPRWQRIVIALAGPAVNIVFAVILLTGVFMVRYEHPAYLEEPAVIGWVMEGSAAEKAGLKEGDRIIRVENTLNPTWEDLLTKELLSARQPLPIAVQRGPEILNIDVVPEPVGKQEFGSVGWVPKKANTITEVLPDFPAAKAGIKVGDEIIAVGETPVRAFAAVRPLIQQNGEKPVDLTVLRNGQEMKITVTPKAAGEGSERAYLLGLSSEPSHVDKLPFTQALNRSIEQNKRMAFLIVELVQKMAQRKVSVKQIDGPIGIARISGQAARQEGWAPLIMLMAAISINLGIFNLLPIPIMDGGVILLLLIESVIRRDISLKIKERIYQASFVFLVLFAAMVIFNDIRKIMPS